jgi:hypothetical protein
MRNAPDVSSLDTMAECRQVSRHALEGKVYHPVGVTRSLGTMHPTLDHDCGEHFDRIPMMFGCGMHETGSAVRGKHMQTVHHRSDRPFQTARSSQPRPPLGLSIDRRCIA